MFEEPDQFVHYGADAWDSFQIPVNHQIEVAFDLDRCRQTDEVRIAVACKAREDTQARAVTDGVVDCVAIVHTDGRCASGEFFAQPGLAVEVHMVVVEGDPFAVLVALVATRRGVAATYARDP